MVTEMDIADFPRADGKELAAHYRRLNEDLLRRYPDGVRPAWVSEELTINEYLARCAEGKDIK